MYYVNIINIEGRDDMISFKETEILHPLYAARLENKVVINVYGDRAEGSDGKTYYHIGREDSDGILRTVGWSCEIQKAIIIE